MRIDILAYDGCMGAEVFGFADLLLVANRIHAYRHPVEPGLFDCMIVSAGRSRVTLAGGALLEVGRARSSSDLLVVPAFDFARSSDVGRLLADLGPELALISNTAARGRVASICGGAFLLAEANVLTGRKATTAWALSEVFMRRYPAVRLEPESMLVRDEKVITCGAFTAYSDLALAIVTERAGAGLARAVARFSTISRDRPSQAAFIDSSLLPPRRDPFARDVERWLSGHMGERYDQETAARAFGLSARTFLRRVRETTGKTPLELLQTLRLQQAKTLLASTGLSIAEIASRVGYQDVPSFHRLFKRLTVMTPAAYRRMFQDPRGQTDAPPMPDPI